MMSSTNMDRVLTQLDYARLRTLARQQPAFSAPLGDLLDEAALVPSREVPAQIATMYSQLRVRELASGIEAKFVVCYPADADAAAGFVSVLSPAGSALLGLAVGALARWRNPDGSEAAMQLLEILYQPEASGDYEL